MKKLYLTLMLLGCSYMIPAGAQIDEDQVGGWYTLALNNNFSNSPFGLQGDIQHRNWAVDGDLEQLLIRGAATWSPQASNIRYALGAAHIRSGAFGPSSADSEEVRLYQEALVPQTIGEKLFLTHRFRLEQRWVENQDERNRLRYFLGLNYPLNQISLKQGAIYLSFYNEIFLNLEHNIGNGRSVDYFDRNRAYAALGYSVSDKLRVQFGYMQQDTDTIQKGQLQLNFFASF